MPHTPGPWAFKEGDASRNAMSDVFKATDEDFKIANVVCESRNVKVREIDIGNARLIAAAPELLAACEAVMAHWSTGGGCREDIWQQLENAVTAAKKGGA